MTEPIKRRQERPKNFDCGRRSLITRLAGRVGLTVAFSVWAIRRPAADNLAKSNTAPSTGAPSAHMDEAMRMRRLAVEMGDQGYGAVIVKDGAIVGRAPSRVVVNRDPTAHEEMEAIRDAARNLATRDLRGCILYSTSRACPMCEAAAYWANLDGMRFGASIADAGQPRLSRC